MKKTIFIFCMAVFSITMLHATPVGSEQLTGTWVATVEYNNSFDTYKINLSEKNRCTVKISNDDTEQESSGRWSWDGAIFKLNVRFRNSQIHYQKNIQWASALTFIEGNDAFNILGKPATNSSQIRFTFFRHDGVDDEDDQQIIPRIFSAFSSEIPLHSRLAIINNSEDYKEEGDYYADVLTSCFVSAKQFTVTDRKDIDTVMAEHIFQTTGYVSDDSFVSIGKFIGATVVISVNISGTGPQKRMVIKAIDVLTAEILAMSSVSL